MSVKRGGKWTWGSAVVRRPGLPEITVDKQDIDSSSWFREGGQFANHSLVSGGYPSRDGDKVYYGEIWHTNLEDEGLEVAIGKHDARRLAAALLAYADEMDFLDGTTDAMPDYWDIDPRADSQWRPRSVS